MFLQSNSCPVRISPSLCSHFFVTKLYPSLCVCLSLCVRSLHCPILFNRTCSSTCVDVHPPCVVMRFIKTPRGVIGMGWDMTTECVERNFSLNYPDLWLLRNFFFLCVRTWCIVCCNCAVVWSRIRHRKTKLYGNERAQPVQLYGRYFASVTS